MKRFFWLPVLLAIAFVTTAALAQPQQFDKDSPVARFPDLDQNRDYAPPAGPETTWCAPTAAANSVWYFGNAGYPELIPAAPVGNVAKADALITSLGALMGTADPNGTTIPGTVAGLSQYFVNNTATPFTVTWKHAWSFGAAPSARVLWFWMATELWQCGDVLPIIWLAGAGGHQVPPTNDAEIEGTKLDSVGGHLVTMTAYNMAAGVPGTITVHDPDDAAVGAGHVFPAVPVGPPGKVTYNLVIVGAGAPVTGTALQLINPAGALHGAWIVGAISASPVPEPSMLLLGGAGALLLLRRRRRK